MRETESTWERWRQRVPRVGMVGLSLLLLCGLLLTDIAPVAEAAEPGRDRAKQERITSGEPVEAREAPPRAARRDVGTEIVGGQPVPRGTYTFATYVLAFITIDETTLAQTCTGSLIDPRHVVTAAHCVEFRQNGVSTPIPASDFVLFIGQTSRLTVPEANTFFVAEVFPFPGFNPITLDFDVAVLRLTEPVPSSIAKPVRMVAENDSRFEAPGQRAVAAGWGLTAGGLGTFDLMQMTTSVISDAECDAIFGGVIDDDTAFCARVPARTVCSGDSGGPLFVLQNASQARQGRSAEQAGKVSAEGKRHKKHKKRKKRKKHKKRKQRKQQRKQRRERRRNRASTPLLIGVTSFGVVNCPLGSPNGFTQLSSPVIHDFVTDSIND